MEFRETETVELKSVAQEGVVKELVAFVNCNGGTVYIGVADDGTVLGVEDPDACALQISNAARDSVKPENAMGNSLLPSWRNAARTGPIILRRKGFVPKACSSVKDILPFPRPMPQSER